jgi:hypothetical protein
MFLKLVQINFILSDNIPGMYIVCKYYGISITIVVFRSDQVIVNVSTQLG